MAAFILVQEIPDGLWQALSAAGKVGITVGAAALALGLGLAAQRLARDTEPAVVDPDGAPQSAPSAASETRLP
jgi:hypothetical protein